MSTTNKKPTTESGPEAKVGKRAQPKARDVKVQLKQQQHKDTPDKISYTLHLNDTTMNGVFALEAKTKDGQVVKMNGPFAHVSLIKTGASKNDKMTLQFVDVPTGLEVTGQVPQ